MRTPAAALVLGLGLVLTGCSAAEEEPEPLPPVPSASPTAAPVPSPPAEAAEETPQGAAAFSRYWLAVLQAALAEGDATALRAISDPGCGGCANLIGAAEGGAAGERIRGGAFTVQFAEAPPVENGEVIVELRYVRAAGELLGVDGAVKTKIAAEGPIDAQMRLQRRGQSWVVLGFRGKPV